MNFVLYTLIISQICRIIKYIYNNFSFHKGISLCGQADGRLQVYAQLLQPDIIGKKAPHLCGAHFT